MRLARLRLVRTPGIREAFTVEPVSGINLVTGPNGTGKSSICRAVMALLWPGAHGEKPFEATAEFVVEDRTLKVERRDLDAPVWNGPKPDPGPDHLAVLYRLGVLDLLQPAKDGDPLAREIRRQMIGGFDLDGVLSRFFGSRAGQAENRALKAARGEVADRVAHQRRLAAEQGELEELKRKRDLARQARDRLSVLTRLQELAGQKSRQADALARLADHPAGVRNVRDDDPARLENLRLKETELLGRIKELNSALATTENELADPELTRIPTTDLPLDLLKKKLRTLAQLGPEIRQAEREASDPNLRGILREPPRKQAALPFALVLIAGALLLAAGLVFTVPGAVRLALLIIGGGLAGAGLLGLVNRPRHAGHEARILDKQIELARKKDHLAGCLLQQKETLAAFNATLESSGIEPVAGPEEAEQFLEDLTRGREKLRELRGSRDRNRGFLDRDQNDLKGIRDEIGAMFGRLELASGPESDSEVSHLLDSKPDFDRAVSDRNNAGRDIARLEKEIESGRAWLNNGESAETPGVELALLIEQETDLAGKYDGLQKTITTIDTRVADAMASHDLEQAAAAEEAARATLEAVRRSNREAALGNLLLDRVAAEHEQRSRPAVLAAAMEYFRLFTAGRHELKVAAQNDGPDRFQAEAEDSVAPLELAELSDGTRAQLLLAVKLAFITAGEQGARPPIFLDDSLASADPVRFAAVAAGLGRMAERQGRQIFYLTPNPADAAAFQRALDTAGLPAAHHIDLAEVRLLAGAADPLLLDPANLPANIMAPDPSGLTVVQYAEALRVPRPDPWARPGSVHVLFLLEDDLDLVRRLVDGNAATLTRFEKTRDTLLATGEITEQEARVVAARGKLWSAWLDGWRIGRAQPVTREFLDSSKAVSEKFLDRLETALKECGGDGAGLLEIISARKVRGIGKAKLEQLRHKLEDADLLPCGEPLTGDELLTHIRGQVAPLLAANLLDMQKVRTKVLTFEDLIENSKTPTSSLSS